MRPGKTNKNNLPDGKGTILFQSRDKDYPDDNDMYIGEFINGTKTGIGKYTYLNDRNIGKNQKKVQIFVIFYHFFLIFLLLLQKNTNPFQIRGFFRKFYFFNKKTALFVIIFYSL